MLLLIGYGSAAPITAADYLLVQLVPESDNNKNVAAANNAAIDDLQTAASGWRSDAIYAAAASPLSTVGSGVYYGNLGGYGGGVGGGWRKRGAAATSSAFGYGDGGVYGSGGSYGGGGWRRGVNTWG